MHTKNPFTIFSDICNTACQWQKCGWISHKCSQTVQETFSKRKSAWMVNATVFSQQMGFLRLFWQRLKISFSIVDNLSAICLINCQDMCQQSVCLRVFYAICISSSKYVWHVTHLYRLSVPVLEEEKTTMCIDVEEIWIPMLICPWKKIQNTDSIHNKKPDQFECHFVNNVHILRTLGSCLSS